MKQRDFSYYPGCSLHGTAKEYDISTRAVCEELGINLIEVSDWNCCGATSAHSIDQDLALLLPARNLKTIQEKGLDVIIPCAACFSRTKHCANDLKNDKDLFKLASEKLGYDFKANVKIYHLMELLVQEIGLDEIKKHIKKPLEGLKVVCYYGCLLVRPHEITELDDKENPQFLDQLMESIGIATTDWPYKTECCGASLSLSRPEVVKKLVANMTDWVIEAGVDAIVSACPLCQANLDMRQTGSKSIPVFYFTELLGLCFGLEKVENCLKTHIVSTKAALETLKK